MRADRGVVGVIGVERRREVLAPAIPAIELSESIEPFVSMIILATTMRS